jgi:hypothetical protein
MLTSNGGLRSLVRLKSFRWDALLMGKPEGPIKKYFGKSAAEIAEADVEAFVQKNIEEKFDLEYKEISSYTNSFTLSKAISAFAKRARGRVLQLLNIQFAASGERRPQHVLHPPLVKLT